MPVKRCSTRRLDTPRYGNVFGEIGEACGTEREPVTTSLGTYLLCPACDRSPHFAPRPKR